jgi:hypothetical protein
MAGTSHLGWNNLWLPPASQAVETQFQWFVDQANLYSNQALGFASDLATFSVDPLPSTDISFTTDLTFVPFEPPTKPDDYNPDTINLGYVPDTTSIVEPSFGALNALHAPTTTLPVAPTLDTITAPTLDPIDFDPTPPTLTDVAVPVPGVYVLPDVPLMETLNLPSAPDIDFEAFTLVRPELTDPTSELYNNDYVRNANESRAAIFTQVDDAFHAAQDEFNLRTGDNDKALTRLGAMLDGGSGLPAPIEQALFDRGISREEISSQQAVVQSFDEWAARGFSLPGATLLARVQEARQKNRDNRGQINRELTIEFYKAELDNLRFAVEKGIALQGQLFEQYLKMHDSGRDMADKAFAVAQAIFDARVEIFKVQLQIYAADIDAFKARLSIELAELDVYKAQIEGEIARGQINEQRVRLYEARLKSVDTQVGIFKSQVEAANAQIGAQASKVELYKGRIEAYKTSLDGEKVKVDIYTARLAGEENRVKIYEAQVRGFAEVLSVYDTEAKVEISKIDARNRDNEARTNRYQTKVQAWSTGVTAQISHLQALTEVYKARLGKYTAELGAEQARVQGESRNVELVLEGEKAKLGGKLKQGDQAIAQWQHATSLGLETIKTAAQTLSQLAASAMAAINVSAGISNTLSSSTGWSSGYEERKTVTDAV